MVIRVGYIHNKPKVVVRFVCCVLVGQTQPHTSFSRSLGGK